MMAEIVTAVTTVFTAAVGWLSTIAGFIVETPIVLFFVVLTVVGMMIGIIKGFVPSKSKKRKGR